MSNDLSKFSFEESLNHLETLVRQLEEGRLPLEEALTAFEKGSELKKNCEEKLKNASLRVRKIIQLQQDENNEPTLVTEDITQQ